MKKMMYIAPEWSIALWNAEDVIATSGFEHRESHVGDDAYWGSMREQ